MMSMMIRYILIMLLAIGLAACGGTTNSVPHIPVTPVPTPAGVKVRQIENGFWRIEDSTYNIVCYSAGSSISCIQKETVNE